MTRRWLFNLLLLFIAMFLSLAVQQELERDRQVPQLSALHPESIERIRLERTGQPTMELVREGDGWHMEAPYQIQANEKRIRQLVRIATTPILRALPETVSLKTLGLSPASITLTLDDLQILIGNNDPTEGNRYVARDGRVFLIGDGFYPHLIAPAEAYVARQLFPKRFHPKQGTFAGERLTQGALDELEAVKVEEVSALGETPISGQLLELKDDSQNPLRFLISSDGQRWARLDLRLVYLVATPPPWLRSFEELP